MRSLRPRDGGVGARQAGSAAAWVVAVAWIVALCLGAGLGCQRSDRHSEGADSLSTPSAAPESRPAAGTAARPAVKPAAKPPAKPAAKPPPTPAESGSRGARQRGTNGDAALPPPAIPTVRPAEELSADELRGEVELLRREHEKLALVSARLTPQEPYILINTTLNRMSMKIGDDFIVRDAVVSTGSNTELIEQEGKRRSWFFSTPKGVHTVKRKMVAPVWVKPDWAFVEEGEPIPGAQAEARFEEGTLGRYGLYFGNGYLIHGTLFQRFLGQSVTHGCVRVGDADLEAVYQNAKVGTRIYIY